MALRTSEILHRDGVALAFGMEWFPLLGGHPHRQAVSLARRRRASHRVVTSGAAASVGLLRDKPVRQPGGQRFRSAAAVFASLNPVGTVAAIMPFPGDRQWLVAVHEGAVMTRTDQLHNDLSSVHDVVRLLREAHPGLVVHDGGQASSGLLDALFGAAKEHGELLSVRGWPSLPAWLLLSVLCSVSGLALLAGHSFFSAAQMVPEHPETDPATAWRNAVAAAAHGHTVHGVAGLRAVLDALHAAPVYLAGWLLKQVECHPKGMEWHCRATFQRDEAGDNNSLSNAALPGWSLSFDPMEGATAAWSVAMPALSLKDVRLRSSQHNETRLLSALQAMLPAFSEFRLDAAEPLPVQTPLNAQHQPVVRPAGIPAYQRRAIHLQAPLRSLSLLLPDTAHMSWDRVVLHFATLDQPTLRSSSLRLSLSGVLYEINDPHPASVASVAAAVDSVRDPGHH